MVKTTKVMRRRNLLFLLWGVLSVSAAGALVAGCSGHQSTLDAMWDLDGEPIIEAEIIYRGPGAKWGGPKDFRLRISAATGLMAEVTVDPPIFELHERLRPERRSLASARNEFAPEGLTTGLARERLHELAGHVQVVSQSYFACHYPVVVRLKRLDGAEMERRGCRGEDPWIREVSRAVHDFLEATVVR